MPPGNRAWEPKVAPHNTYPCAGEDRWIAIDCMSDAEWQALVRAMDEPRWAEDPKWSTNEGRLANEDELDERVGEWTSELTDYEAMELLQAAGVRAGVCQKASDRFERDPQLRSRGWWHQLEHPEIGLCDYDGVLPKLSLTPGVMKSASPVLGADTHDVLRDVLGMNEDEIAEQEAMGVLM
jgi:crotonobetainyl-CoA:carnitine CoA-transferase CaiB-like acyl-CoA transferase